MKNIAIIGSTGSIGTQTLDVVRANPDKFRVIALCAGNNAELLLAQANEFKPRFIGIANESLYEKIRGYDGETACGEKVLEITASYNDVDLACVSVVGMVGLRAVFSAINSGKDVALSNKESLVAAGELVMRTARERGVNILPVDSEHSAIWQCLRAGNENEVKRIILTASGGAFRGKTTQFLKTVTPQQAVKHPNWSMGKKITVDSATMMNKGLEIIEARWLFDNENIDYIIHPQSIIHSMVEFVDGAIIAQMSQPDMKLPIMLALSYPQRISINAPQKSIFNETLQFLQPNENVFPMPKYAREALKIGGNAPCTLNAANEVAVDLFLHDKIKFTDIFDIAEKSLSYNVISNPSLKDVYETYSAVTKKIYAEYS